MPSSTPKRVRKTGIAAPAAGEPRRLPPILRRCWFNLNQAFRRRIAHTGITPDQFTAMRTITEGDPLGLTQRDLTVLMSSDPNTIASLLERMETAGLVERLPHEQDRRAYRIHLKPLGRKKFNQAKGIARKLQREVLSALPSNKQDEFLIHLEMISNACRKALEKDESSK